MTKDRIVQANLFFIAGRGRSGTTLLSTLLDSNRHVIVSPESGFVVSMHGKYKNRSWSKSDLAAFYDDLKTDRRIFNPKNTWGMDPDALKKDLMNCGENPENYLTLCKYVLAHSSELTDGMDIRAIGNKFPAYTLFLARLAKIAPKAKFVCVVRDYRDNIVSYKKVPYEPSKRVTFHAWRWRWYNLAVFRFAKAHPSRVIIVRYEDLVTDPPQTLLDICRFLDVPYDENMQEFYKKEDAYQRHSGRVEALKGLRPVNKASLQAYKKFLTKEEIEIAAYICDDLSARFGYEKERHFAMSFYKRCGVYAGMMFPMIYTVLEIAAAHIPLRLRFLIPVFNNLVLRIGGSKEYF